MDEKSFRNGLNTITAEYRDANSAYTNAAGQVPQIKGRRNNLRAAINRTDAALAENARKLEFLRMSLSDCDAKIAALENELNRLDPEENEGRAASLRQQISALEDKRAEFARMEETSFCLQQQLEQTKQNFLAEDWEIKGRLDQLKQEYEEKRQRMGTMRVYLEQGINQYTQTQSALADAAATKFHLGAQAAQRTVSPVLQQAETLQKAIPALLSRYKAVFSGEGMEREIER